MVLKRDEIEDADRSQSDSLRYPGWMPEQFLIGEIADLQVYDRALVESASRYLHSHPGETHRIAPSPFGVFPVLCCQR